MTYRFFTNITKTILIIINIFLWQGLVLSLSGVGEVVYGQNYGDMTYETPFRSRPSQAQEPIQSEYPAVGKIVGRGKISQEVSNQSGTQWVYYGSCVYVAELNDYGIVITNWHVVSQSDSSIKVIFPSFSSEGVVLLADEVWDLAAVIIRRPSFLPIPITLEVPQANDTLWVGGYGPEPGLEGFKMKSGRVLQYMTLGVREGLPVETMAIEAGVRQGDSGGPVFNKYGELAGILWGTQDGWTMCTFCLRLQAFLTQAQYQLINVKEDPDEFFRQRQGITSTKMISKATTPAQEALQASGIYPISSRPIYRTALLNGSKDPLDNGVIPSVKGIPVLHPPYPPVESPTLLAQREVIGRENPEVYPESTPFLKKKNGGSKFYGISNQKKKETQTSNFIDASSENQSLLQPKKSSPNTSSKSGYKEDKINVSQTAMAASDSVVPLTMGGNTETPAPNTDSATESDNSDSTTDPQEKKEDSLLGFKLNHFQTIIVALLILFLFFNSLKFLSIAREK